MGLQLKEIIQGFAPGRLPQYVLYGGVIGVVALIVRLVWSYPATLLPRWLSPKLRESEEFDRRNIWVFSWAGMRGIVSMAAALAIPVNISEGIPFPFRSEIIFLTFCVILFTLVFQGLTLPLLIKRLHLPRYSVLAQEYKVRSQMIIDLKTYIGTDLTHLSEEVQQMLYNKYEVRQGILQQTTLPVNRKGKVTRATAVFNEVAEIELKLLQQERTMANALRQAGATDEEVLRKIEREIDLEEARLEMQLYRE
jgi:CPA1 family monovalent cation:H+ antiporter